MNCGNRKKREKILPHHHLPVASRETNPKRNGNPTRRNIVTLADTTATLLPNVISSEKANVKLVSIFMRARCALNSINNTLQKIRRIITSVQILRTLGLRERK